MLFIVLTGYPIYDATTVALETVRKWLELKDEQGNKNADLVNITIIIIYLCTPFQTFLYEQSLVLG